MQKLGTIAPEIENGVKSCKYWI